MNIRCSRAFNDVAILAARGICGLHWIGRAMRAAGEARQNNHETRCVAEGCTIELFSELIGRIDPQQFGKSHLRF